MAKKKSKKRQQKAKSPKVSSNSQGSGNVGRQVFEELYHSMHEMKVERTKSLYLLAENIEKKNEQALEALKQEALEIARRKFGKIKDSDDPIDTVQESRIARSDLEESKTAFTFLSDVAADGDYVFGKVYNRLLTSKDNSVTLSEDGLVVTLKLLAVLNIDPVSVQTCSETCEVKQKARIKVRVQIPDAGVSVSFHTYFKILSVSRNILTIGGTTLTDSMKELSVNSEEPRCLREFIFSHYDKFYPFTGYPTSYESPNVMNPAV